MNATANLETVTLEQVSQFLLKKPVFWMMNSGMNGWPAMHRKLLSGCLPDDDDKLTENPQSEISLIYYPDRQGLEDRIFRIKTERSSATMPDTRTSHNISNIEIVEREGGKVTVRFNWNTLSYRYKTSYSYFGMSRYMIDFSGSEAKILSKYVVLKNDYINQVIDIYHI